MQNWGIEIQIQFETFMGPILHCFWTLSKFRKIFSKVFLSCAYLQGIGGFHLHRLAFPFIYQFNSRIEALVWS